MADDSVSVQFGAQPGDFVSGVDQVKGKLGEVKEGVDRVGDSFKGLNELIDLLKLDFLYEQFKKVIEAGEQWTAQVRAMSTQLGLSSEAASGLSGALAIIGVSSETYASAAMKLDRQIRTNEQGVNKLGVATRDVSTGALLPQQQIMLNAIDTLNQYQAGTDRNLASQILFGRGVGNLTDLLRLNADKIKEGTDYIQGLGLAMDQEGVAASVHYKEELNKLHLVMVSIEKQITEQVLPALIKLGEWFDSVGPAAIGKTIAKVEEYARALGSLYALIASAGDPDLRAAVDDEISDRANGLGDKAQKSGDKPVDSAGSKAFPDELLKHKKSTGGETQLQQWKDQLTRQLTDEQNFFSDSKKEELDFWEEKLQYTKEGSRDRLAIETQVYQLQKQLAQEDLQDHLATIKAKQEAVKDDFNAVIALEQQKLDILKQDYGEDSRQYQVALREKEAMDRQHAAESDKIYKTLFQSIDRAFGQSINGILQGTQTWQNAIRKLFSNILSSFVDVCQKMVTKWLEKELFETAATNAGNAARVASDQTASDTGIAAMAIHALKAITADAAQTFGGIFAFLAPEMGPAAAAPAAAGGAAVVAAGASIPSAAGGWVVPNDTMAMVHQDEMILPARLSQGIQGIIAGAGGGGGGGDNYNITIQAIDTQSGAQFLKNNAKTIAQAMSGQIRNFNPNLKMA